MVSVDVLVMVVADFGLLVVLVELVTAAAVDVGFKWLEEL